MPTHRPQPLLSCPSAQLYAEGWDETGMFHGMAPATFNGTTASTSPTPPFTSHSHFPFHHPSIPPPHSTSLTPSSTVPLLHPTQQTPCSSPLHTYLHPLLSYHLTHKFPTSQHHIFSSLNILLKQLDFFLAFISYTHPLLILPLSPLSLFPRLLPTPQPCIPQMGSPWPYWLFPPPSQCLH
jgi:hypothetical protein